MKMQMQRPHTIKRAHLWVLILSICVLGYTLALAEDDIIVDNYAVYNNGSTAIISDIRVTIDAPLKQRDYYASIADQLIPLHSGDPLTEEGVQASIELLKLSHRFSAIHVDSASGQAGETLIYTLTPYQTIADIKIQGRYPLFERDVLNQMTLYPGDPYTRKALSAQTGAIIKRYKREGYIDPKVSITEQWDTEDENAVILVDIEKGRHYVLDTLTFQGNNSLSENALKLRMAVWWATLTPWGGRFSEYKLKKDMDSLLAYYRSKGFANAELTYNIVRPPDSQQVDVTVQVQEGQCYTVDFTGNEHFWDLTLEKDVAIFKTGNRNNIGVRKSIRNMVKRYREAGYLETSIEADKCLAVDAREGMYPLCFVIREGPQTVVEKVTIAGNKVLPEKQIKKQVLTRPPSVFHNGVFVPDTLDTDVYAVTTLYLDQGFGEREVDPEVIFNEDKTGVDVSLNINEGPQTKVASIVINGLTVLPEEQARKALVHKIGDPFRAAALAVEKEAIASLVSEKGYPHAMVQDSVVYSEDRTRVDIVYKVDTGPLVILGNIYVSGNLRTDEKVIQRELEVQTQAPLSLQALYDGQRRLRDMEIFHGVSYRTFGLKEKVETVDLFVEIEENKPYYTQGSIGYQSDNGFFGRARVGDRNLFGLNKDLWASGEISETGYRFETRFTEPRFLGTRTTASIGVFNERLTEFNQPFGTQTTGGSLGFSHSWGRHLMASLSFILENREQFSVEDQFSKEYDEEARYVFVTTPFVRYDTRDSFVRPTQGLLASFGVNISKGEEGQLDDFIRYQLDTRYYWTPLERLTFAGLARIGQAVPYGDSDLISDDQLFYLGGIQSVRGFDENLLRFDSEGNPVGGKTAIVGSLEARIDLGRNLELATFFDIGRVQDTLVNEGVDTFRSSVGIGLRYITPIGPIGLLYGHKLDPEDGESAGRFHFSVGYSF